MPCCTYTSPFICCTVLPSTPTGLISFAIPLPPQGVDGLVTSFTLMLWFCGSRCGVNHSDVLCARGFLTSFSAYIRPNRIDRGGLRYAFFEKRTSLLTYWFVCVYARVPLFFGGDCGGFMHLFYCFGRPRCLDLVYNVSEVEGSMVIGPP